MSTTTWKVSEAKGDEEREASYSEGVGGERAAGSEGDSFTSSGDGREVFRPPIVEDRSSGLEMWPLLELPIVESRLSGAEVMGVRVSLFLIRSRRGRASRSPFLSRTCTDFVLKSITMSQSSRPGAPAYNKVEI